LDDLDQWLNETTAISTAARQSSAIQPTFATASGDQPTTTSPARQAPATTPTASQAQSLFGRVNELEVSLRAATAENNKLKDQLKSMDQPRDTQMTSHAQATSAVEPPHHLSDQAVSRYHHLS